MKFRMADLETGTPYLPTHKVRCFRDKANTWNYVICLEDHDDGKYWFRFGGGKRTIPMPNHGGVLGNVRAVIKNCVRTGEWVEIDEKGKILAGFAHHKPWWKNPKYKRHKIDKKPWKSNAAGHKGQQAPQPAESQNANTQRKSVVLESREPTVGQAQPVSVESPEHSGRDSQGSGTQTQHQLPRTPQAVQEKAVKSALVPLKWAF